MLNKMSAKMKFTVDSTEKRSCVFYLSVSDQFCHSNLFVVVFFLEDSFFS